MFFMLINNVLRQSGKKKRLNTNHTCFVKMTPLEFVNRKREGSTQIRTKRKCTHEKW